ncbi:ubiquinone/menaquinone biosynthesis methyltransferase [Sedimentisphaera cyanobacteriorum]|uniref:Ubiquinone/menaquinone biosynthesis methyltransferase n=1 Tax=Sedimentisphaera cyanobacteriorum TaxID=1940790 RepID=A0A1Q2HQE7_9BACT|nr:class I SAM-dependent methyltransferase [Sedimentisphaera cyanobacteriorum]AQQ09677.1 ubiquinone/menaquinone biosynthesis methyltransferase [Sedimentisphaera cyanobacteriorum]
MEQPFDSLFKRYDQWYESPKGKRIFKAELKCLQKLAGSPEGRWLEVGTGTGRFAARMGINEGLDPSKKMLELASSRGIKAYQGFAENAPLPSGQFSGVMLAFTLCFIDSPKDALSECWRLLVPGGKLLIGIICSDNPWGRAYQIKKSEGHPIYKYARFLPLSDTIEITKQEGFELEKSASTLFWNPEELPQGEIEIRSGLYKDAGFSAMLFTKTDRGG